ncbi:hypothetical protein BDN72DRAFT_526002 [Pluteus cervinus]|uniref:Uncharacterized protein n=1 Tax=Pluteus cervinus TaxID=181527 RepID=A0ACD3A430_9AGAR|nr:hypothetical protein BDN72DRAFT_526002 [Pluteus cervinus]
MLLAGLLTRAALEGYVSAGRRGTKAVECLLTVGLGIDEDAERKRKARLEEKKRKRAEKKAQRARAKLDAEEEGLHVKQEGDGAEKSGGSGDVSASSAGSDSDSGSESEGFEEFQEEQDMFKEFEPDELPSLKDAVKILFPALRKIPGYQKSAAEEEYDREMRGRLRRVSRSSLISHFESFFLS